MSLPNVKFEMKVESGNEAIVSSPISATQVILERIVKLMREGRNFGIIHDSNGNKVGEWSLIVEEKDDDPEDD
jgi:hypothetical protein